MVSSPTFLSAGGKYVPPKIGLPSEVRIIVSGQLGMQDGALVSGGVAAQTAKAVENLRAQLASVGADLTDIAKTLCFLTDMDTFAAFNDAYVEGFGTHRPARSTIGVAALPAGAAVGIEAWAYKPVQASK